MGKISRHMLSDVDKLPAVQLGEFLLQVELDEPSESVMEIARRELRETPDVVQPAIDELRRLLKEDKELYVPLESDSWLVRFLRPCKFYPDSAYDLIKRYYAFKVKHQKHYEGLIPSKEQNIFNQNILTVLPTRDQHGRRVLVLELGTDILYMNPVYIILSDMIDCPELLWKLETSTCVPMKGYPLISETFTYGEHAKAATTHCGNTYDDINQFCRNVDDIRNKL